MRRSPFLLSLPIALNAVVRAIIAGLKALARIYRFRREALVLAGFNRSMLTDIGLSEADLRDALSQPFWKDPTALLSARAGERRQNRHRAANGPSIQPAGQGFVRPPLDRPARQSI